MKKTLRVFLLIIAAIVLTISVSAYEEALIVDNSSFEETNADGLAFWSNINGELAPVGDYERSSDEHHDGKYSAKITKPSANGVMGIYSAGSFGVNEYRMYTAEAYVYTADSTLNPELYIEFFDVYSISCGSFKVSGTAGKGKWEKLSVTALAPKGAVMARVMPHIGEGSYGTMYVDAVTLTKKSMLDNGNFDDGIDSWEASSGSVSCENEMLKVSGGKVFTNTHYAASGVEYVLMGTATDISDGKAYASLVFYSDDVEINKITAEIEDGFFSVRGYAPIDVTAVGVCLEAEETAYFDDLFLTPVNKGTQVQDGSFESMGENGSSPWTVDTVIDKTELLPGGDFETNDWSLIADYEVGGMTKAKVASGTYAGFFTSPYSGGMRSPMIPVTVGETYTAKMKYLSVGSDMQFYIEFWSDGPADADASKRISTGLVRPAASSTWTEATVSGTAPQGAKYMTVTPYYSSSGGFEGRTAYIDDISIVDSNGEIAYSYGFEDFPELGSDWCITDIERCSVSRNVHKKHSGNMGFTLSTTGTGGGGSGFRSPMVKAEAGNQYTAKIKYITLNSTLRLYIEFWTDETFTTRLGEDYVNLPASAGWSWTDGSITRTAPEGTNFITVCCYFLLTEGGAVGYFDDISLRTVATSKVNADSSMAEEALNDGKYSFKINAAESSAPTIPVLSGKNYVATATVQGDNNAKMTLTFYDNKHEIVETKTVTAGSSSEERLIIDTIAPLKSFYARITLKSQGEAYFDNVELYTIADTIANPSFENTDNICGGKHATQWQSFGDAAALTYGDKNLENPDGTFAMEIYGTGDEGGIRSNMINVSECEDYTARIMAKGDGGLRIAFYNEYFERVDETSTEHFGDDEWTKYSVSGTAPYGTSYAVVEVVAEYGDYVLVDNTEFSKRVTDIGSKNQLFIDDFIIAEKEGVTRTFHQAEKTAPILEKVPENKHEENGVYVYGTVIYDEEERIYKMWYTSYCDKDVDIGIIQVCYATSVDGVNWEKPSLGLVEFNGSTDNNIIGKFEIANVIKDKNESDPAKRYKMITYTSEGAYSAWYSADGLSWTRNNYIFKGLDVISASWDNTNNRYYSVVKLMLDKRNQWTMVADNINGWSVPVMSNTLADLTDTRLCRRADSYGMGLYERDGVYIGFNWLFYIPGTNDMEGVIEPQLAFSRDLTDEWQRPTRTPIIPLGEEGSFDDGVIVTASTALEVGDEVWMYCGAFNDDHGTSNGEPSLFIAKWRLDGFASLDSEDEGVITTRPFTFDGESLYINANASEGTLLAELLDENGNVIDGFSKEECRAISSDSVKHAVYWNGSSDVSALAGEEVSLRIYSENSEIYSFAFGERAINAPESIEEYALRASGKTSGIRFLAEVTASSKSICDEYGFIVARADILEKIGASDEELTFDLTHEKYPEPLGSLYVKGEAYKVENGKVTIDKIYDNTAEGAIVFSAVCTDIDVKNKTMVSTQLTVRPYIKLGEQYAYGKPMTKSLYEVAVLVKNSEAYDSLSDEYKNYVEDIIQTAENTYN